MQGWNLELEQLAQAKADKCDVFETEDIVTEGNENFPYVGQSFGIAHSIQM